MTCEELLRLLDEEGDVSSGAAQEHLADCPECARARARWQAVQRSLIALGEEEPPPYLHTRIMAHLGDAERAPALGWFAGWRLAFLGSFLVVALIGVAGGLRLWRHLPGGEPADRPLTRLAERGKDKRGVVPTPPAPLPAAEEEGPRQQPAAADDLVEAQAPRGESSQQPVKKRFPPSPPIAGSGLAEPRARPGLEEAEESERAAAVAKTERAAAADEMADTFSKEQAEAPAQAPSPAHLSEGRGILRAAASGVPVVSRADGIESVACSVVTVEGEPVAQLSLPLSAAPSEGERWLVTVGASGELSVAEQKTDEEKASLHPASQHLLALRLPPGDYRLARVPAAP